MFHVFRKGLRIVKTVRIDLTTDAYEVAVELAEKAGSTVPTTVSRAANRILELIGNLQTPFNASQDQWTNADDLDVVEVRSIDGKEVAEYNITTGEMRPINSDRRAGS